MSRRVTAAIAAVVATGFLAACSPEDDSGIPANCTPAHQFDTLEEGVLTVSAYALPPISIINSGELDVDGIPISDGGTMEGIDGEILDEIAKMECLEITVNSTAAAAVLPTVQAGQADLAAANWFRTESRAKILDFSDPIYLDAAGIISADGESNFAELKARGARVGTVLGYMYVTDLRDYFQDSLVLYNSPLTMHQELKAGNIDAGVDSAVVAEAFVKDTDLKAVVADPIDEIRFTEEPAQVAFPVQKGNTALLKALNEDIATLRESGRLAEILEGYGLPASAAEPGEPRLLKD